MDVVLTLLSNIVGSFDEKVKTLSSSGNYFDFVSIQPLVVVLPKEN